MKKEWKLGKNRGFTLVEVIVTIAIMSIVGGAIASFVVVSQNNYNYGAAETDLQYEAQLLANQLQDLIIDTARGISYQYNGAMVDGSQTGGFLVDDSEIIGETAVSTKELYIYDKDSYYKLNWNRDERKIYYSEYAADAHKTLIEGPELMAEFVTAFSVDLREVASNRTVKYYITFQKEGTGREYTTTHKIKLRNEVLVNAEYDMIYVPEAPEVVADSIRVEPGEIRIWPGDTYDEMKAVVSSASGLMPSQKVLWNIEKIQEADMIDAGTMIKVQGGKPVLTAASGESVRSFYVKAKQGSIESNPMRVLVRYITRLNATVYLDGIEYLDPSEIKEGSKQVEVRVYRFNGDNLEDLVTSTGKTPESQKKVIQDMGGVTVSIQEGAEYLVPESIAIDEAVGKITFDIKKGIDFGTDKYKIVKVKFTSSRSGVSTVREVRIKEVKEEKPIDTSKGWDRNGYLDIDMSVVPSDMLQYIYDTVNVQINVFIQFYRRNANGNKELFGAEYNFGNQGGWGTVDEKTGLLYQNQDGNHLRLLFGKSGDTTLKLQLLPDISYSHKYCTDWGMEYTVDGARIKVVSGGYESDYMYADIAPVTFRYREATDKDWTEAADGFQKKITVNPSGDDSVCRVYYMCDQGWNSDNDDYDLEISRLECSIQNSVYYYGHKENYNIYNSTSNRLKDHQDLKITKGTDENGAYLEFAFSSKFVSDNLGDTMKVLYEGNPQLGHPGCSDTLKEMKGCEGTLSFTFVKDNVSLDYKNWWYWTTLSPSPSALYCPTLSELKNMGISQKGYYYINSTERYYIEEEKITYQQYKWSYGNGKYIWENAWKKTGSWNSELYWLEYDESSSYWIEENTLEISSDK